MPFGFYLKYCSLIIAYQGSDGLKRNAFGGIVLETCSPEVKMLIDQTNFNIFVHEAAVYLGYNIHASI